MDQFNTVISKKVFASGAFAGNSIGYGLPQGRQRSCFSWLSEINTLKRQKIHQETVHLLKFFVIEYVR